MEELLLERPPWFVAGPLIGLIVVGLVASINQRLAVLGAYAEVVERVSRRELRFGWKVWFLLGIIGGGLVFTILGGPWRAGSYGWMSRELPDAAIAPLLLLAGGLIGFGAKMAGGCTSGHGISGCSFGSPASFAATMTFMATAVAGAFALRWVIG